MSALSPKRDCGSKGVNHAPPPVPHTTIEQAALSPEVVASRSKSKRRLITSDDDDDVDRDGGDEEEDGGWEQEEKEEGNKERGHPVRSPGSNTRAVDATGRNLDKDEFCGRDQGKCGLLAPDEACQDVPEDAPAAVSTPAASTGAAVSSAAAAAAAAAAVEANVGPRAVKAVSASAIASRGKGGDGEGRSKKRLRLGGLDELEEPGWLERGHAEVGGVGDGGRRRGAGGAALVDLTLEGNPVAVAAVTAAAATTTATTTAATTATGEGMSTHRADRSRST